MAEIPIRRISATPGFQPPAGPPVPEVAMLVDLSLCTGCKGCEVACKVWNRLPAEITPNTGSLQTHSDLSPSTWLLVLFNEVEVAGELQWLLRKNACHHCVEPSCLLSCPAPGAIIQYQNGAVVYQEEACIGCGTCVAACPFGIPRLDSGARKSHKCQFCFDRLEADLEPACAKTCPTGAISFDTRSRLLGLGEERVRALRARGFPQARIYDPPGVGGTHQIFVIPFGGEMEEYGLPPNPRVPSETLSVLAGMATVSAGLAGFGLLGAAARWMMASGEPGSGKPVPGKAPRTGEGEREREAR